MNYQDSPHLIEVFDFDILHMELNTPLFIFVLVIVVMVCLHKLLFQPVLRTLENRQRLAQSLQEAATANRAQIEKLIEDYEAKLSDVRTEVAQVRAESARATQSEVSGILEQAREEAQAEFQAAMNDLQQQVEQAKRDLGDASNRLAEQTTNRILHA